MPNDHYGPLILDVAGTQLCAEDREILGSPSVGGVILFSRNFVDRAQLKLLVQEIRATNPNLLITVDHEGGRVQRFRDGFTLIPPMQKIGQVYHSNEEEGILIAKEVGWLMAAELIEIDIDLSFAPVLDLDDVNSQIIGDRSFSPNANDTVVLASAFIAGMAEAGMYATGKHFPGHGGVKEDSHLELPDDKRSLDALEASDIVPFAQLSGKLSAIMPAHIVYSAIDGNPVCFSNFWLQDYLRQTLKFDGVIFSDDLSMEGAAGIGDYCERAKAALLAGCDAILVCNNRRGAKQVLAYLQSLEGSLTDSRLGRLRHQGNEKLDSQRISEAREIVSGLN